MCFFFGQNIWSKYFWQGNSDWCSNFRLSEFVTDRHWRRDSEKFRRNSRKGIQGNTSLTGMQIFHLFWFATFRNASNHNTCSVFICFLRGHFIPFFYLRTRKNSTLMRSISGRYFIIRVPDQFGWSADVRLLFPWRNYQQMEYCNCFKI